VLMLPHEVNNANPSFCDQKKIRKSETGKKILQQKVNTYQL